MKLESLLNKLSLSAAERERVHGLVARGGQTFIARLVECVDASQFTAEEWVEALIQIDSYLQDKGRSDDPRIMLGYVACCADSLSASGVFSGLREHVDFMLRTHEFKGSVESID